MLAFSNDYYGMIFRATQSVELFCAYGAFSYGLVFCAKYVGGGLVSTYMLMILQRKWSTVNTDELVPLHVQERLNFQSYVLEVNRKLYRLSKTKEARI